MSKSHLAALALLASLLPGLRAESAPPPETAVAQVPAAFEVTLAPVPDAEALPLDPRLFGHFLERPSWAGENGPEAMLLPGTRTPRPDAVALMRGLRIPVLRFPGGTDIDYHDWTDLIDDAPGRASPGRPVFPGRNGQPVTQEFGFPEYFALARELGAETILVVNLLDGLAGRKPLAEAARHAAALVAYCNAPLDAALPEGLEIWPALRARHGSDEPHRARYIQIGNEWWMEDYRKGVAALLGTDDSARHATWVIEVVRAYVAAIRAVDPKVELIVDGAMWHGIEPTVLADPVLRAEVRHAAIHIYTPWSVRELWSEGERLAPEAARERPLDWWWAFMAQAGDPGGDEGQARLNDRAAERARALELGYQIAYTEWNFVTWWELDRSLRPALSLRNVAGPGTASLLHALMRAPGASLATQSMLVGQSWDITGIRVDPTNPAVPAHYFPQAQVMRLYNQHRGDEVLPLEVRGTPIVRPVAYLKKDLAVPGRPRRVGALDALATRARGGAWYLHLVNRDPERAAKVELAPGLRAHATEGRARLRTLAYGLAEWTPGEVGEQVSEWSVEEPIVLPPRSVSVLTLGTPGS